MIFVPTHKLLLLQRRSLPRVLFRERWGIVEVDGVRRRGVAVAAVELCLEVGVLGAAVVETTCGSRIYRSRDSIPPTMPGPASASLSEIAGKLLRRNRKVTKVRDMVITALLGRMAARILAPVTTAPRSGVRGVVSLVTHPIFVKFFLLASVLHPCVAFNPPEWVSSIFLILVLLSKLRKKPVL